VPTAPKPSQYDNVSEYTAAMALAVKPGTEVEVIAPYAYSNYALTPGLTGRIACVDTYGAFVEFGATANENGAPVGSMQGPTAERMWRNCVWLRYGNLAITGRQREAPAPADMDEMLRNGNFLSAKEFRNPYVNYENQDQGLPNMHLAKYDDYLAKVLPPGHVLPVKDANTGVEGVLGRAMTAKVPIGHGTVACVRWNDGKTTHVLSSDSLTPVGPARKEDFTPPSDAHIVCDAAMLPRGTTIRRGPDWKWKDQGSQLGSVVGRRHDTAPGWVIVRWDNGETNHYRMGAYQQDGKTHPPKYDLEVALTQGKEEKKRGFVGRLLDRFRR
jgi:hypothetical protein